MSKVEWSFSNIDKNMLPALTIGCKSVSGEISTEIEASGNLTVICTIPDANSNIDSVDPVEKLSDLAHSHDSDSACIECGHGASSEKPKVNRWEKTSHQSSRNNADIDHIVIHYTTSRNIEGTINHFKHGAKRTSAHYIIGRDGTLVQMVNDSDRAWHAGNSLMNARSIGIEHVAAVGDGISKDQTETSVKLIAWLIEEYEIEKSNIIPHNCIKSTSCCGELFKEYGGSGDASCNTQKNALHQWLASQNI